MNEKDKAMMDWVRTFNSYDLYTKSHERPDVKELPSILRRLDR
jgi:inositol oxygenase